MNAKTLTVKDLIGGCDCEACCVDVSVEQDREIILRQKCGVYGNDLDIITSKK